MEESEDEFDESSDEEVDDDPEVSTLLKEKLEAPQRFSEEQELASGERCVSTTVCSTELFQ